MYTYIYIYIMYPLSPSCPIPGPADPTAVLGAHDVTRRPGTADAAPRSRLHAPGGGGGEVGGSAVHWMQIVYVCNDG